MKRLLLERELTSFYRLDEKPHPGIRKQIKKYNPESNLGHIDKNLSNGPEVLDSMDKNGSISN